MYFLRLATLKPVVEELAREAWEEFEVGIHNREEEEVEKL